MKKFVAILLLLAMALSVAACSDSSPAPSNSPSDSGSKEPATTQSTAPSSSDAPAKSGTIKIGMHTTLTGNSALSGQMQEKGARIAIEEINDAGGINNRLLELVVYDDQGTPENAVTAVTRMIEMDKVDAIIGSFSSPNIVACAPLTEEAKMLYIGCGTSASFTNAGYEYLFRGTANGELAIKTVVDIMANTMGVKTVATLTIDTEYGQSGFKNFKSACDNNNVQILANETFQANDTDFTGQMTKMIASNPDAVFIYGSGAETAIMAKQLRRMGWDKYIYSGESAAAKDVLKVADEAANGIVFAGTYFIPASIELATNDLQKEFLTAFVAEYGELPTTEVAYRAYDSVYMIVEAMKNVNDISDKVALRDAFRAIKGFVGIGGTFDFTDGSGDGLQVSNGFMILDKKIVNFNKAELEAKYGK